MPAKSASKVAGVNSDAVRAKTGKGWAEWIAILDQAGAKKMSHKEIVAYLNSQHSVPPWWQQMVTVGYEQYRGLRQKHETPAGFQASASKTIAVPVAALYQAWADDKLRAGWLPRALTVRKATPDKSLRISWARGKSEVDVNLYARGPAKSQVALEHRKLASAEDVAKMKAFWKKALEKLKDQLESESKTG